MAKKNQKVNRKAGSSARAGARGGRASARRARTKASPRSEASPRSQASPQGDGDAERLHALPNFPVIGIGASAGGLEACTQIFEALPADLRAAVIVIQHLAPRHESALPELLGINCRLPVVQVK